MADNGFISIDSFTSEAVIPAGAGIIIRKPIQPGALSFVFDVLDPIVLVSASQFLALVARVTALENGGVGGATITQADMSALFYGMSLSQSPSGGQPWDNAGTIAFGPGSATGSTLLTAAAVRTFFSGLPTTPSPDPGMPWNDGNTLAFTAGVPSITASNWTLNDLALMFAALDTGPSTIPFHPWNNGRTLAFS